jgi:hypothetical protein
MNLSLLGILPPDDMAALLRDELARQGWELQKDGSMKGALKGETATLDKDATQVTVTVEGAESATARGVNKDLADAALETARARTKEKLQADAAKKLTAIEPDLRAKLGEAIQKVYVEALRKKAASLGTIESLRETTGADGEYEVTIKVKT